MAEPDRGARIDRFIFAPEMGLTELKSSLTLSLSVVEEQRKVNPCTF
jgi:hypothetical protein